MANPGTAPAAMNIDPHQVPQYGAQSYGLDDKNPQPQQQYGPPSYDHSQAQPQPQQQVYSAEPKLGERGPVVSGQGPDQFANATPLTSLNRGPAPVDCPACHRRAMTQTTHKAGGITHLLAVGLCVVVCLGCIPYCVSGCKNVQHRCGNCGTLLATWHRSGGTPEIHVHA